MIMHQQNIDYQAMKIVQPTQASMGTILIEELNQATEIVNFEGMLSHSSHLARFAKNNANSHLLLQDLKVMAEAGPMASLVAIESVAQLHHQDATKLLINCLTHNDASVRRQATWRLANRHPVASALTPLLQQLSLGGIDTMHAHHTLEKWSNSHPELIAQCVGNALLSQEDPLIRSRLVDLLGVLSGESIIASLGKLAADNAESVPVRLAAISSLGCRAGTFNELLSRLAK